MIRDPMNSTLTKRIQIDRNEIIRWCITTPASYDIVGTNKKLSFITGSSVIEDDLDNLKLPIVVNDNIVVDLRDVVKPTRDFESLEEIIRQKSDYKLKLLTGFLVDISFSSLDEYRDFYVKSLQVVLGGGLKSMLSLDVNDLSIINSLLSLMAVNSITEFKDYDTRIAIAQRLTMGGALDNNKLEELIGDRELNNIDDLLVIMANANTLSVRAKRITKEIMFSTLGGGVFMSHRLHAIVGVEAPSVWLAVCYIYSSDKLYKKTQLAYRLDSVKKLVDLEAFHKSIKLTYNGYLSNNPTLKD